MQADARSGPGAGAIEDFGYGVDDEVDEALAIGMQCFETSNSGEGRDGNGQSNMSETYIIL